jgi:hypothetical protein
MAYQCCGSSAEFNIKMGRGTFNFRKVSHVSWKGWDAVKLVNVQIHYGAHNGYDHATQTYHHPHKGKNIL